MDPLKDIFLSVIELAPQETLVEKLAEDATVANLSPTEENLEMLAMSAQAYLLKRMYAQRNMTAAELRKDMDEFEKAKNFFKTGDN